MVYLFSDLLTKEERKRLYWFYFFLLFSKRCRSGRVITARDVSKCSDGVSTASSVPTKRNVLLIVIEGRNYEQAR